VRTACSLAIVGLIVTVYTLGRPEILRLAACSVPHVTKRPSRSRPGEASMKSKCGCLHPVQQVANWSSHVVLMPQIIWKTFDNKKVGAREARAPTFQSLLNLAARIIFVECFCSEAEYKSEPLIGPRLLPSR
jgi:hypothetical protein